jgi:DNA-binding response OmpR family regulator
MAKILLIEDNDALAETVSGWLRSEHHLLDVAHCGDDAFHFLDNFGYDLLILDWELPDTSGPAICQRYRHDGGTCPIIFLTGRSDIDSKKLGLDSGADDYLTKPFDFMELSARVRALLRRLPDYTPEVVTTGGISLQKDSLTANVHGQDVTLSKKEFAILEFLLKNANQQFDSNALKGHVWAEDSSVTAATVRSAMRHLRRKITVEGHPCPIETIGSAGYMIKDPL